MRDIKFRGKPVKPYAYTIKKDGSRYVEFEYGGFYRDYCYGGCPEGKDYIICFNSTGLGFNEHVLVEKASVGQFTGLKDKNGTEIYEGDIILFNNIPHEVYLHPSGSYQASGRSIWEWISEDEKENEWEVIGNVYENPDLLK